MKEFIYYPKKWRLLYDFSHPGIILDACKLTYQEPVVEKAVLILIERHPLLQNHRNYMLHAINCQRLKKNASCFVAALAKEYSLYVLTNIGEESIEILYKKYNSFFKQFHIIFHTKKEDNYLCKPKREYFIKHLSAINLPAFFVDDKKKNLITAEQFGLQPILFSSFKQLQKKLNQL